MSRDDTSLSLRAPVRETVFHPFPLASPSGALYIERMFLLRLCINQPIHYLRLYRSLYSNIILAASYSLSSSLPVLSLTWYSSLYRTTSRCLCYSKSCANHVTKLAIMLIASFLPSYPPRPTHYRPRHRHPHRHPLYRRTHRVVLIALYSLYRIVFANFLLFPTNTQSNAIHIKTALLLNHSDGCDTGCLRWEYEVC